MCLHGMTKHAAGAQGKDYAGGDEVEVKCPDCRWRNAPYPIPYKNGFLPLLWIPARCMCLPAR